MTGNVEESTPFAEPTGKKKAKKRSNQCDPKTGETILVESQCNNDEDIRKKKHKKKAVTPEDAVSSHISEIDEIVHKKKKKKNVLDEDTEPCVPKKKKKKNVLDDDIAPCDPKSNVVPKKKKKKSVLHGDIASSDPKSNDEVHQKKKKKKVLDDEIASCDPKASGDVRKKKNVLDEDNSSCLPKCNEMVPKKKEKKTLHKDGITLYSEVRNDSVPKSKTVIEDNTTNPSVPQAIVIKKKKKKKNISSVDMSDKDCIVARHKKITGVLPLVEENKTEAVLVDLSSDSMTYSKLKKHKKKKMKSQPDKNNADNEATENGKGVADVSKVHKKKKDKHVPELVGDMESQNVVSEIVKVKKKRKAASVNMEDVVIDDQDVHLSEDPDKQDVSCRRKSDGDITTMDGVHNDAGSLKATKRKNKRKVSFVDEIEGSDSILEDDQKTRDREDDQDLIGKSASDDTDVLRKKNKKKKNKKEKERAKLLAGTDQSLNPDSHTAENKEKPKKRKKVEIVNNTDEEDTIDVPKKKKKRKGEMENPVQQKKTIPTNCIKHEENPDVRLLSVKAGNSDEIHIDKVRRKALQEDVDRESGNTKGTKFGQWDTASFQNSDHQTKFFRLLGGFKKENQAAPPAASNASMALGKLEEQTLERNLLAEFDKALDWKQNRGIGLGFEPAQKNTFYIDKTVSKSVKFED